MGGEGGRRRRHREGRLTAPTFSEAAKCGSWRRPAVTAETRSTGSSMGTARASSRLPLGSDTTRRTASSSTEPGGGGDASGSAPPPLCSSKERRPRRSARATRRRRTEARRAASVAGGAGEAAVSCDWRARAESCRGHEEAGAVRRTMGQSTVGPRTPGRAHLELEDDPARVLDAGTGRPERCRRRVGRRCKGAREGRFTRGLHALWASRTHREQRWQSHPSPRCPCRCRRRS